MPIPYIYCIYIYTLGGGFKYFWNFHPYLGKIPILTNIFSTGLKPPTSTIFLAHFLWSFWHYFSVWAPLFLKTWFSFIFLVDFPVMFFSIKIPIIVWAKILFCSTIFWKWKMGHDAAKIYLNLHTIRINHSCSSKYTSPTGDDYGWTWLQFYKEANNQPSSSRLH